MPPHISRDGDGSYPKAFSYIHPGLGKNGIKQQIYQPHIFQQSVTLTATIWDENNSQENMEKWNFNNWGALAKYSPLIVGLVCGFGIVLIVMSTVMLWRYCLLSATKKVCCKGNYGVMNTQLGKSSAPFRKERDDQNGFESHRPKLKSIERHSTFPRSATIDSTLWNNANVIVETERNCLQPWNQRLYRNELHSSPHLQSMQVQPLMSHEDMYVSHLYLQKPHGNCPDATKYLSRSVPALEELYTKVNFSKKKKNRMRKDEAAIIAMSKSHSVQTNSLSGSAVVVYNERTAL